MRKYEKYKDSGIEWLGVIPEHWGIGRVKDITTKVGSGITPRGGANVYIDGGIMFFRSQNIHNNKLDFTDIAYISAEIDKKMANTRIRHQDILLNITGASIGRCFYVSFDVKGNVNQHVCIIRPKQKNVNTKFFHYSIISDYGQGLINVCQNGANREGLNFQEINNFVFLLPGISEQVTIANYLDAKTQIIDKKIELLKKKIDTYKELRKSLINKVVCRGLDKDVKLKDSGIDWIGKIPEHWTIKRAKDVFNEIKNISNTGKEDLLSVSEYYGVAKKTDITDSDEEYISRADSLEGYKICREGDLVINIMLAWKRGLGVSSCNGIVSPAYSVYRAYKQIRSQYFHYLLRTDAYANEFKRNSKGIIESRLRLYSDRFFNISLLFPPIEEQKRIAGYLEEKTLYFEQIISNIQQQIEKLQELRKTLINDVVTGKTKVTE